MSVQEPRALKYIKPELGSGKAFVKLCRTVRMVGFVQVIAKGGENNLHAHRRADGFWLVRSGRVRFNGEERRVLIEPFDQARPLGASLGPI